MRLAAANELCADVDGPLTEQDRPVSPYDAFEPLRKYLLALKPSGPDGFEGLVAAALADLTGLVFRLAKSGSQFGRDASSPPATFAIAMEAKRYSRDVSLETLAGKATIACQALGGAIDLWVVAATAEVGDDTALKLDEILNGAGIALLVLDWAARPLPQLAVLFAATPDRTKQWFADHAEWVSASELAALLEKCAADPAFRTQAEALRASCASCQVGLGGLQRQASLWLKLRLRDRRISQQSFGQFITVSDPSSPAVHRTNAVHALTTAVASVDPVVAASARAPVVAVLGEEGTGKSWLVSQWWAELSDPPIPIFVAGRRKELLVARDPMASLANLLADQAGPGRVREPAGWRRRLERWAVGEYHGALRFVLILDGLNEYPMQDWVDIVRGHADALASLGGIVIVTSRSHFWHTAVRPVLAEETRIESMTVEGYTPEELAAVLQQADVNSAVLPTRVRTFVSNPRVCAIAIHMLPSLNTSELTVERLLMEYWRRRFEERGDLTGHRLRDFQKLLVSHAREWLENGRRTFEIDEWLRYSGVAARGEASVAARDLSEICEGRFLTVVSEDRDEYAFRDEALPYALGLLIIAELERVHAGDSQHLVEYLDGLLEPIRGVDLVGDIIAAATGLACLKETCVSSIREVLILTWCELQNTTPASVETMAAYLPVRPAAFFAAAEAPSDEHSFRELAPLAHLFLAMRDHPRIAEVLPDYLARWLTQWSWDAYPAFGSSDQQSSRQAKREGEIRERIASLSAAEAALFRHLTTETRQRPGINLGKLAAIVLAGRPLEPHAPALLGWSVARAVAPDVPDAYEELAWVARLNRVDSSQTSRSAADLVRQIEPGAAPAMRSAAAGFLNLFGDDGSAALAERYCERGTRTEWRRVALFCDTNPHDPDATVGTNFENARAAILAMSPADMWTAMGVTAADHTLDMATPALARFDPELLVALIRRVINGLPERRGLAFRQLAWRLPSLSPLLEPDQLEAVRSALDRLLVEPTLVEARDYTWIAAELASAQVPHLSAGEQLDRMIQLPPGTPLFLLLRRGAKPLAPAELERRLIQAEAEEDLHALRWTMFFVNGPQHGLTEAAHRIIMTARESDDETIRVLADRLIERYGSQPQVVMHREGSARGQLASGGFEAQVEGHIAITGAEGQLGKNRVVPDSVAADDAVDCAPDVAELINHIETVLTRVLKQAAPDRATFDQLIGTVIPPDSPTLRRIARRDARRMEQWVDTLMRSDGAWHRVEAYNIGYAIASAYADHSGEGAAALFRHLNSFASIARLTVTGIPLADAALFAASDVPALDSLRGEAFADLFDDGAIECMTVAAERYGATAWLERFIDRLLASATPGDTARALTIAGLRKPNHQSDTLLARSADIGFLSEVAEFSLKNYRRDSWARRWLEAASSASDGISFWRFGVLAEGVVDVRTARLLEHDCESPTVQLHGEELTERLVRAAEKRSKNRKTTLFGLKAPPQDIIDALRRS